MLNRITLLEFRQLEGHLDTYSRFHTLSQKNTGLTSGRPEAARRLADTTPNFKKRIFEVSFKFLNKFRHEFAAIRDGRAPEESGPAPRGVCYNPGATPHG